MVPGLVPGLSEGPGPHSRAPGRSACHRVLIHCPPESVLFNSLSSGVRTVRSVPINLQTLLPYIEDPFIPLPHGLSARLYMGDLLSLPLSYLLQCSDDPTHTIIIHLGSETFISILYFSHESGICLGFPLPLLYDLNDTSFRTCGEPQSTKNANHESILQYLFSP